MSVSIQDVRSFAPPQKSYLWSVNLLYGEPLAGRRRGEHVFDRADDPVTTECIQQYARRVTFNFPSIESEEVPFAIGSIKYASKISVSGMTIEFYEDELFSTTKFFDDWRNSIVIPETNSIARRSRFEYFGYPDSYKGVIWINPEKADRNTVTSFAIKADGCFPTSRQDYEFAGDSSQLLTVSQSFSVDDLWLAPTPLGIVTVGNFTEVGS